MLLLRRGDIPQTTQTLYTTHQTLTRLHHSLPGYPSSALSRTPLPARTPPVYVVVLLNRCLYKLTEVYDFRSIPALTRLYYDLH